MTLTIHHTLFNIENERPFLFQYSFEFAGNREKPLDIFVRRYSTIGILPLVCIGRGCNNLVNRI